MAIKSRIRHGYCSHAGGAVATQVEVVALNALSVSKWVRGVDQIDPGSCESEIFQGRSFPSSGSRMSRNAIEGAHRGHADADRAWRIRVGGALIRFFRGF
jgi:hypothetical protein